MDFSINTYSIQNVTSDTGALLKWTTVWFTWNQGTKQGAIFVDGKNIAKQTFSLVSADDVKIPEGSYLKLTAFASACSLTDFFMVDKVLSTSSEAIPNDDCISNVTNPVYSMESLFATKKHEFETAFSSCDALDDCVSNPCGENNICNNMKGGFSCNCTGGYSGSTCNEAPDFCLSNVCVNGATCLSHFRNYTCQCLSGFKGAFCEVEIVNGNWGEWIESPCSKSCGGGSQSRTRYCNNPTPDPEGKPCDGLSTVEESCNTQECPSCVPFYQIQNYKNTWNCTSVGDTSTCSVSCQDGYTFIREIQPLPVYECGPHTGYEWNSKPPPCASSESPRAMRSTTNIIYDEGCAAKEGILIALNDRLGNIQCVTNQTCKTTVEASGCSGSDRKKRSTNTLDITVQLYTDLSKNTELNLEDFYANKIVSPGLLTLVQAYVDSANSIYQINSSSFLTIDINGNVYTADMSAINASMNADCNAGTVEQELICVNCPQGTYWTDGMCVLCAEGTFQDETGQLMCKACPAGYTTYFKASKNESDCSVVAETTSAGNAQSSSALPEDVSKDSDGVMKFVIPVVATIVVVIATAILITVFLLYRKRYRRLNRFDKRRSLGSIVSLNMVRPSVSKEQSMLCEEMNFANDSYNLSQCDDDVRCSSPPTSQTFSK